MKLSLLVEDPFVGGEVSRSGKWSFYVGEGEQQGVVYAYVDFGSGGVVVRFTREFGDLPDDYAVRVVQQVMGGLVEKRARGFKVVDSGSLGDEVLELLISRGQVKRLGWNDYRVLVSRVDAGSPHGLRLAHYKSKGVIPDDGEFERLDELAELWRGSGYKRYPALKEKLEGLLLLDWKPSRGGRRDKEGYDANFESGKLLQLAVSYHERSLGDRWGALEGYFLKRANTYRGTCGSTSKPRLLIFRYLNNLNKVGLVWPEGDELMRKFFESKWSWFVRNMVYVSKDALEYAINHQLYQPMIIEFMDGVVESRADEDWSNFLNPLQVQYYKLFKNRYKEELVKRV